MMVLRLLLAVLLSAYSAFSWSESEPENIAEGMLVTIADPFIELHSGPGQAYPIFHVVDRGATIVLIKRKTTWFKVKTEQGVIGWASKQQMQRTLLPSGQVLTFNELSQDTFRQREWEIGMSGGKLADAPIISITGAYVFNDRLLAELSLGHSIANVSSSTLYKVNLLTQPFPEWEYSPFFTLGFGSIQVDPKATLINPKDKNNTLAQVGFGIKKHLTRRFVLRFEANQYVIFSSSNDNDENEGISEWKVGFSVFF